MLGGDLQSDIMQGASALVRNALLRLMDRKAESLIAHDTSRYEIQLASKADLSIQYHGKYYSVNTTGPLARWNREAFQMLYLLFQMTVSEVPRVGIPSITIAK